MDGSNLKFQLENRSGAERHHEIKTRSHESMSPLIPGAEPLNAPIRELNTQPEPHSECSNPEKLTPVLARWRSLISDTWFYEIVAIGFSVLCFIAILCVLRVFDQRPSPYMSFGLTLNTIISMLATAFKTSLVFLLGELIGQLKWIWFRDDHRPVSDMQTFDTASRGPLGSFYILLQHKGRSLVSLGAAITLLSITVDPFMQQILSYHLKETSTVSSSATAKQSFAFFSHGAEGNIDFGMRSAVNAAMWADGFETNPSCPSGNCTWPAFRSIGWCSRCQDMTASASLVGCDDVALDVSRIHSQSASCNISLSNGQSTNISLGIQTGGSAAPRLLIPRDVVWASYSQDLTIGQDPYSGMEYPIVLATHAALDLPDYQSNVPSEPAKDLSIKQVSQCALSLCAMTYHIAVSSGVRSINTTSFDYGEFYDPYTGPALYGPEDCWQPGHGAPANLTPDGTHLRTANWQNTTEFAFCPVPYFGGLLNQFVGVRNYEYYWIQRPTLKGVINIWGFFGLTPSLGVQRLVDIGLEHAMHNIAASLTKLSLDRSNRTVNGTVSHVEILVAVDWKWIILPVVLVVAGVIFLVCVLLVNRRRGLSLWKSSVLPILHHGRDDDLLPETGHDPTSASQMEHIAESVNARLQFSDTRRRLLRQRQQPAPKHV